VNEIGVDTQSFQVNVAGPAPTIVTTPITGATAGVPYSYTVCAIGGPPAPALSATGLPAWLSFDTSTGALTGTPAATDVGLSCVITITASNGTNPDAQQAFQITVSGTAPMFTSSPVVDAFVDRHYSYVVSAAGLPAVTLSANAPAWLTFDAATGTLSGVPSVSDVGEWPVEITADTGWGTAMQTFTITVPDPVKQGGGESAGGGCVVAEGSSALAVLLMLGLGMFARFRTRRS
jgi:large repetitive protein